MRSRLRQRVEPWAPSWARRAWLTLGSWQWTAGAFARNYLAQRQSRARASTRADDFPPAAENLLDDFRTDSAPTHASYDRLFLYFLQGWETFRTPDGTGAEFPGLPSWSGPALDRLEGFARLMPLLGAWVASGRSARVRLPSGSDLDLTAEFARGLLRGTDPSDPHYWGAMHRSDQRIVEAADIALALWLFRDAVWERLASSEQQQVANWLGQASEQWVLDNNWHLFVVLIERVLSRLGRPVSRPTARRHHERVKTFHLGDGWFRDGPGGRVDYYNAWGFHYLLTWIDRIDPDWDPEFVRSVHRKFLATFRYLIAPDGFPVLGRSVIYRMATPAPLVFGQVEHPDIVAPGVARRALDCTWSYFIRRGAVEQGRPTQGYFGTDPRIVDNYSGPASPLWSLRSLVAAFSLPETAPFWTAPREPLPVEREDYTIPVPGPGWIIHGHRDSGVVSIEIPANNGNGSITLARYSMKERFLSIAYDRPRRPDNAAAKYDQRVYRSNPPFTTIGYP